MNEPAKILVIRNDKIGDFMLAWPAFALLKKQYPEAEITALVPDYTADLARHCQWIDVVLIDQKEDNVIKDIFHLYSSFKSNDFDLSISLYSEMRTAFALWLSGIKNRIGPATKAAQLFLNNKLTQKRSQSRKPEYQYNLDLIEYQIKSSGHTCVQPVIPPFLRFIDSDIQDLKHQFYQTHSLSSDTKLIAIHPGTGGSALNVHIKDYAEIINRLAIEKNLFFVITAGPGELPNAKALAEKLIAQHYVYHSTGSIIDFSKFINIFDLFIGGSTGPLHIAGALNIFTVGFYPSKTSATALRWQTLNNEEKRLSFSLQPDENENNLAINPKHVCDTINKSFNL